MDKQKLKEPGFIADELVSVRPEPQACFPPLIFAEGSDEPAVESEEK